MTRRNTFRIALYLPLIVVLALTLPRLMSRNGDFRPPSESKRIKALGQTNTFTPLEQKLYLDVSQFEALGPAAASDWLNGPGRKDRLGQTVRQFKNSSRNAVTAERRTIYLQPWDDQMAGDHELLKRLQVFTEAYYQLPVKILPASHLKSLTITSRLHHGRNQLLTTDILNGLATRLPDDAYCVIALTFFDLYPQSDWNFVFGQASLVERVGVFSFNRYGVVRAKDNPAIYPNFFRRSTKVMAHEIGHIFGIQHCIYYQCIMNGSGSLAETDKGPLHACPVCLRKMQLAIGFDSLKRYQDLQTLYLENGLKEESQWLETRLKTIHE